MDKPGTTIIRMSATLSRYSCSLHLLAAARSASPAAAKAAAAEISSPPAAARAPRPAARPDEAATYPDIEEDRIFLRRQQSNQFVGSPETVCELVAELVERTAADELMIRTQTHDNTDRLRSYELVADALDLASVTA